MFLFSHFLANFSQEKILQLNYAGRKTYKMNFTVITSIYNPIRITTYLNILKICAKQMKFVKEFTAKGIRNVLLEAV